MASGLPNLGAPSDLGAILQPSLMDPMRVNNQVNMGALKTQLRDQVFAAATEHGEPLRANWSNLFECTHACNVLFDLTEIYADAHTGLDIEQLATKWFTKLTDESTLDWTLESACDQHQHFHKHALFSKPLGDVYEFFAQALAFSTHSIAQMFEDNHLGLLRNTFCLQDGCAQFGCGRLSLLVAISGGSKSPLMKIVQGVLQSQEVVQAFQTTTGAWAAKLKDFTFYATQGANLEGWLAHAKNANDPVGLLVKLEEVAQTICKLGVPAKDKMAARQVIDISNVTLTPGKRLGSAARCSAVKNLKIVMSCPVQGKMCYLFLPFTDEGESYRWYITVSPDEAGLNVERADKLCDKTASENLLKMTLATQVLKILGVDNGTKRLDLKDAPRGCIAHMEKAAKACLRAWVAREGHARVVEDPLYVYLRGKLDSTYMTNLLATWCQNESLLCWLNDAYEPTYGANEVYARMALKRSLLADVDRRAVMLVNRRYINASPYLKSLALGLTEDEVQAKAQAAKRQRVGAPPTGPQPGVETEAAAHQHIVQSAVLDPESGDFVLKPADYVPTLTATPWLHKAVGARVVGLTEYLSTLSTKHAMITHIGNPLANDPNDIEWTAHAANAPVRPMRKRNQRGGHPTCPMVKLAAEGSPARNAFWPATRAIYDLQQ